MAVKRLFFAVPLPQDAQNILGEVQNKLKRQFKRSKISWVDPGQFHVTLHFLGEVEEELMDQLMMEVDDLKMPAQFQLRLGNVDAFPHKKNPKTLVVRTNIHPFILVLRERLAKVLVECGLPIDQRPFRPHVTLGRIQTRSEVLKPEELEMVKVEFKCDQVVLFESELGENGSDYSRVETWNFL